MSLAWPHATFGRAQVMNFNINKVIRILILYFGSDSTINPPKNRSVEPPNPQGRVSTKYASKTSLFLHFYHNNLPTKAGFRSPTNNFDIPIHCHRRQAFIFCSIKTILNSMILNGTG